MLVQPTEDEGEASERQYEPQPTPSPPHPSANQYETQPNPSPRPSPTIPDSIPKGSGGNHGAKIAGKKNHKGKSGLAKESVSKQGRKPAKAEPIVHKDPAFDDLDDIVDDAIDYMESEDAQNEGRTSSMVLEEKESTQKGVSTEVEVSTIKPDEGTDKPKEVEVSTDKLDKGTAEPKDGTSDESTNPTTVFRDDETIVEFLISMSPNKAKQKRYKGKKVLEEEAELDAESEGVDEAERKFDQLAKDEEIARKVQEDWEAEEEMKKLAEEEATKAALIQYFDEIFLASKLKGLTSSLLGFRG
ncbi:hypothetical protein Tco_1303089 [Tanacetum coccineum]